MWNIHGTVILIFTIITKVYGLFENCDYKVSLTIGTVYTFNSNKYPSLYTGSPSSCRWTAYAPGGYNAAFNCYVEIPCATDTLLVSRLGDVYNHEKVCGTTRIQFESVNTIGVVGLMIGASTKGGRFQCNVSATKKSCNCGRRYGAGITTFVVGGVETGVNEYPMLGALVKSSRRELFCACTLIGKRHCLTSAHCANSNPASATQLLLGIHDLIKFTPSQYAKAYQLRAFKIHPQYSAKLQQHDIALAETVQDIVFSKAIYPGCLPFRYQWNDLTGNAVEIVGWGTTTFGGQVSNVPRKTAVQVVSQSTCSQQMQNIIPEEMCTYSPGRDACQFDSGGPVLFPGSDGVLYAAGVISYGKGCGNKSPAVNTRVTSYLDWIKANSASENYCYM